MGSNLEFGIRISADGKVAVVEAGKVKDALTGISKSAEEVSAKTGKVREGLESISSGVRLLAGLNIGTLGFDVARDALRAFKDSMFNLPSLAREFTSSMETNQLGMAGILASMTQMNGRATDFGQAMAISSDMMAKLNQDAIRTAASTTELVGAYRALLGPGLAAQMSLEQIRELTVTGVNAVKSMGLPAQQVVQELRDLVAGGITAGSSTLATALGLRDEDISRAKSSAQGLFSFLMERLSGFTEATERYNSTIAGVASAFQEKLVLSAAKGFDSLTQATKHATQRLTEIVSSDNFVAALTKVSDALVYMSFMLQAAFDIAKGFLLSASLVAGGYAIGAAIAAINTSAMLAAGGMALLNKEVLLFLGGAALQRLEALGAAGKGGLLGLALFGGWEIGDFASRFEPVQRAVAAVLDPVFRFFDRSDAAMLEKLGAQLATMQQRMAEASEGFADTNQGKTRLAEIVDTEQRIAAIRARMSAEAQQQNAAQATSTAGLAAHVRNLEQEYKKSLGTVKTATSIEREYTEALTASQKQYALLEAAKRAAGASGNDLAALGARQREYESSLAKKRSDELRGLHRESVEMQNARIAGAQKLAEIEIDSALARNEAALKLGEISEGEHERTKSLLEAQKNVEAQLAVQQQLQVRGLTEAQRQALALTLQRLTAENQAIHQRGEDASAISRKKMADEDRKAALEDAKTFAAEMEKQNAVVANFNQAQSDSLQNIALETQLLGIQAPLAAGGLLLKEDEIKLASQVNLARETAIGMRKIELDLEKALLALGPEQGANYDQAAQSLRELAASQKAALPDALAAREAARLSSELTKQSVDEFSSMWSTVERTGKDVFTHVFADGKNAFEGIGKAIKASVIDLLYQITARKWILQIGAGVAGSLGISTAGTAMASMGGGATSSLFGGLGGNLASSAMSAFGATGFGTIAANYSAFAGAGAEAAMAAIAAQEGLAVAAGAGGITAGITAGLSSIGPVGWAAIAAGAILGFDSLFGGSDRQGQVVGSGVDALASEAGGFQGHVTSFVGSSRSDIWGGSFATDIPSETLTQANMVIKGLFDTMRQSAVSLGLDASKLQDVTVQVHASFDGLVDAADLQRLFASLSDTIITTLVPDIAKYQVANETLAQTYERLAAGVGEVQMMFTVMNNGLQATFDISKNLSTLFGGADKLKASFDAYYQAFYTDAERNAITLKQINAQFAALGLTMPNSREQFRAMVEALDLTTASGQTVFKVLMDIAPAFDQVTTAAEAAGSAVLTLAQKITATQQEALTAVTKQIQASQDAANTASRAADAYRNLTATLADAVTQLRGGDLSPLLPSQKRSEARAKLDTTFGLASTGDAAALGNLPGVATAFLQASRVYNASSQAYTDDFEQVMTMLAQAGVVSTGMGNWQDNQAALLQAQTGVLEQIKEELGAPNPDIEILNHQATLLATIATLLQEQTVQIVSGNGIQTLLMHDQTGAIVLANSLVADQSGQIAIGNSWLSQQAVEINSGNLIQRDQSGLIASSNELLLDQAGRISLGNALVGTQTNQIITGNATQDAIRNISSLNTSYSEDMLASLVRSGGTQSDSLSAIVLGNAQITSYLQQLVGLQLQVSMADYSSRFEAFVNSSWAAISADPGIATGNKLATFDAQVNMWRDLNPIPGHATGLAYVPSDNYLMRAHLGEAVIDADTMSAFRRYGIPVASSSGISKADIDDLKASIAETNDLLADLALRSSDEIREQTARLEAATKESAREMGNTIAGAVEVRTFA